MKLIFQSFFDVNFDLHALTYFDDGLQIDVEPLIEHLVERSRHDDDQPNDGMKSQLDDALTKRHETEAKLVQAEVRIAQLEETLR